MSPPITQMCGLSDDDARRETAALARRWTGLFAESFSLDFNKVALIVSPFPQTQRIPKNFLTEEGSRRRSYRRRLELPGDERESGSWKNRRDAGSGCEVHRRPPQRITKDVSM
jgi:hypothetical protein